MCNRKSPTKKTSVNCEVCKVEFMAFSIKQKKCDSCQEVFSSNRAKFGYKYNRVCERCGSKFKSKNGKSEICHDCALFNYCKICDKKFTTSRRNLTKKYCSVQCGNFAKANLYYEGNYSKVMFRDGVKCRRCDSTKRTTAHHIDYSGSKVKENGANNGMDNLITLCNSCHQQLHALTNRTLVKNHLREAKEILNKFIGE